MTKNLSEVIPHVDRFADACRRFFFAVDRWNGAGTVPGLNGVDWNLLQQIDVEEINVAFRCITDAAGNLLKESERMQGGRLKSIVQSAGRLSTWALGQLSADLLKPNGNSWLLNRYISKGGSLRKHLQKSHSWLSVFSDIVELQEMHISRREVLQALLEHGPTKGDDLAKNCTGADFQGSQFREMLADMVKDNLLSSGRGRHSSGYRLTDRGLQLAQLSGQLTDF